MNIIIPGQPVPQGRPRATARGGFVRVYDPPRSREWKKRAGEIMREAVKDNPRFPVEAGEPVHVDIIAGFKRPKAAKNSFHTKNGGDLDNIAKAVLDAGNGILWDDDRQIVSLSICKLYVDVPRVEVEAWSVHGYG